MVVLSLIPFTLLATQANRSPAEAWTWAASNHNRFQVVHEFMRPHNFGRFCPDNFRHRATVKLGLDNARGKWVKIEWIKLRARGSHYNRLQELAIRGADGTGIFGFTSSKPSFKGNYEGGYKRIWAFPRNGIHVKWKGDHIPIELGFNFAPNHRKANYGCKNFWMTEMITIIR
jgi:hypothetical protein